MWPHVSTYCQQTVRKRGEHYYFIALRWQNVYPFPSIPWWPMRRLWARGQTGCWWSLCWRVRSVVWSFVIEKNILKMVRTACTQYLPVADSSPNKQDCLAFQLLLTIWMYNVQLHSMNLLIINQMFAKWSVKLTQARGIFSFRTTTERASPHCGLWSFLDPLYPLFITIKTSVGCASLIIEKWKLLFFFVTRSKSTAPRVGI